MQLDEAIINRRLNADTGSEMEHDMEVRDGAILSPSADPTNSNQTSIAAQNLALARTSSSSPLTMETGGTTPYPDPHLMHRSTVVVDFAIVRGASYSPSSMEVDSTHSDPALKAFDSKHTATDGKDLVLTREPLSCSSRTEIDDQDGKHPTIVRTSPQCPSLSPPVEAFTPPRMNLALIDKNILCVCVTKLPRTLKEIMYVGAKDSRPIFVHTGCKISEEGASNEVAQSIETSAGNQVQALALMLQDAGAKTESLLHGMVSPKTSKLLRIKIKNFTSVFHCDGPCQGLDSKDFFLCKRCFAWQHSPCMLYGEPGDRGGPVCNRCYTSFVVHREETVRWQRARLLMAVREGWQFLRREDNLDQTHRREWVRKFVTRFMNHNEGAFYKYVSEGRPELILAARAAKQKANQVRQNLAAEAPAGSRSTKPQLEAQGLEDNQNPSTLRRESLRTKPPTPQSAARSQEPPKPVLTGIHDVDAIFPRPSSTRKRKQSDLENLHSSTSVPPPKPKQQQQPRKRLKRKASPLSRALSRTSPGETFGPGAPRKSAPRPPPFSTGLGQRQSSIADEVEDGGDNGDEEEYGEQDKAIELYSVPAPPLIDAALSRPDPRSAVALTIPPNIKGPDQRSSCRCPEIQIPPASGCFACVSCPLRQHVPCADDRHDGHPVLCNFCFNRGFEAGPLTAVADRVRIASLPAQTPQLKAEPAASTPEPTEPSSDAAIRTAALALCTSLLWPEYRSLPRLAASPSTSPLPSKPPNSWHASCTAALTDLLDAAGPPMIRRFLQPVLAARPRSPRALLRALRELALDVCHRGAWRGRRGVLELGELGVCLGFVGEG